MASYFFTITHAGYIQLLATHNLFQTSLGNKETRMFYVTIVITFSLFLELLWKPTLLVHYKLNMFRTSRIESV